MIKNCKCCGKEFESIRSNHNLCSEECRKKQRYLYYVENKERYAIYDKNRPKKSTSFCKICGERMVRTYSFGKVASCEQMHYECVIRDVIDTILSGKDLTTRQTSRIYGRGLTIAEVYEMAREEMEERAMVSNIHGNDSF